MEKYNATLDKEFTDEENDPGIKKATLTVKPAIRMKGYAFHYEGKIEKFEDDLKYRIAAPILIPMEIYRKKDDDEAEHTITFTAEELDAIHTDMMKDFSNKDFITIEHSDDVAPAFLREVWQVNDPKKDKSYLEYGILCPKGTIFGVLQFEDKDFYTKCVKEGRTGISIEGYFGRKLVEMHEQKKGDMKKMKFKKESKKYRFEAVTVTEGEADGESVIVVSEVAELAKDVEVVVVDQGLEVVEDFTGELVIEAETVKVESGKVTEVVPVAEEAELTDEEKKKAEEEKMKLEGEKTDEEKKKEEEEKLKLEAEKTDEEKAKELEEKLKLEGEALTPESVQAMINEAVDLKLEEVYKAIGELKAEFLGKSEGDEEEEVVEEMLSAVDVKVSRVLKLHEHKQ